MNQNDLKASVARHAAEYIAPALGEGVMIGVGTGSTANFFIDALAELAEQAGLSGQLGCLASSVATAERLLARGMQVHDLNDVESMQFYVDGADECNPARELIKGGGGALTREKIVASVASEFVCIVDETKIVDCLGDYPLPVEVIPMALAAVARKLQALGGKPVHRAGVVTDNGNEILDIHGLQITNPVALEDELNGIPGLVTAGLFARRPADLVFVAGPEGVTQLD